MGEHGFGPAPLLDSVDAAIPEAQRFRARMGSRRASVHGGAEGRAGDAPLLPKWLITMDLRQKNRFNECKECGCESASNHTGYRFGFQLPIRIAVAGPHERARSARKGRKKHVSALSRPTRSPWIVVEQNHNGIGKLMVPAFQIHANIQWNQ